jgi:hypothetical protein
MSAQARRAQGQQQRRSVSALAGFNQRDRDRRPLQPQCRLAWGKARKISAALRDIPPGGIIKWLDHPA